MSKITIIEGNSNDKDQIRNYLIKGEPGVSPTLESERDGTTTTVTMTDAQGEHEFEVYDGVSPIISISKTGGVTTITIVDAEGTKTATINDGEISISDIIDNLTSTATNKPLSANQGKVLKDLVDGKQNLILSGTTAPSSSLGENGDIYLQVEE